MSATEYQFRGSALGGFNRQDVIEYIERTAKEHNEQIDQLNQGLKALEDEKTQLDTQLTQATEGEARQAAESETLRQTLADQTAALESAQDELAGVQGQLEDTGSSLAQAETALADLRVQVEQIAPAAEAYDRIKDRTATIELEAHRRAQVILDDAATQRQQMQAEVNGWLNRVVVKYDRVRTDLDATLAHVSGELKRVCGELDCLPGAFSQDDQALKDLTRCCGEGGGSKVPEPMPLEED